MARDRELDRWFGGVEPLAAMDPAMAANRLRAFGDESAADELAAESVTTRGATFATDELLGGLFHRFVRTTHLCGFLPSDGERIVAVTRVEPDVGLRGAPLKITLDGLHVARYPGFGAHTLLFDFALQSQEADESAPIFHYNAKFVARDGETVPVRNFPLFYGLVPSGEGVTLGFQTINVSSGFDEGLLDFLGHDEFKRGLSLLGSVTPVVGQLSQMAASLSRWLAGQSKNAKVQEFRQGLDFVRRPLGGGLAEGSYVVVQVPVASQREWSWDDWVVDPTLLRLLHRHRRDTSLDFNHLIFGVQRMA